MGFVFFVVHMVHDIGEDYTSQSRLRKCGILRSHKRGIIFTRFLKYV